MLVCFANSKLTTKCSSKTGFGLNLLASSGLLGPIYY